MDQNHAKTFLVNQRPNGVPAASGMANTVDDNIQAAITRYEAGRSQFLRMCELVAEICRTDIVEKAAIHAEVTFRLKSTASLRSKLARGHVQGAPPGLTPDALLAEVDDIAAVRITAWSEQSTSQLRSLVCDRFVGVDAPRPFCETVDKALADHDNFYRALHIHVCLAECDLYGENAPLRGVRCEIQICSMMAHVWNEIEHDIRYKDGGVLPSPEEVALLNELGTLTRHGEELITRLSCLRRVRAA